MILTRFLKKYFRRQNAQVLAPSDSATVEGTPLLPVPAERNRDPWFWSHFDDAAGVVLSLVPKELVGEGRTVLDFGCGDGITALGVASRIKAHVVGLDLDEASFKQLPRFSGENVGTEILPANLAFRVNALDKPFPIPNGSVDFIYSWSVFEHLSNPSFVLGEFRRILKPGGSLLIQIEPLFYSPFGSHLQRLVDEPWAHLLYSEDEFLRRAQEAQDKVALGQQDALYRTNAFEDVKRYLIGEYKTLNKITADDLLKQVVTAGFEVVLHRNFLVDLTPPIALLAQYPKESLLTNEIVLVLRRTP
jgi:ubiquinone/menaquinone biosynthesis C-methylase UbiE